MLDSSNVMFQIHKIRQCHPMGCLGVMLSRDAVGNGHVA